MTATEEIRDHRARCQRHLLTLAMLAGGWEQPDPAATEVGQMTAAVIAEAEAASRAALASDTCRHQGAWTLLLVRLNRLAAAADEAVAAARDGDAAALRRRLHRFESMTSAIWTVQDAVCGTAATASRAVPDHLAAEILRSGPPDVREERLAQVIVPQPGAAPGDPAVQLRGRPRATAEHALAGAWPGGRGTRT
jgi:hypothetical protein